MRRSCSSCGWSQEIVKKHGKVISVVSAVINNPKIIAEVPQKIRVEVSGSAGVGKSAITQLINDCLASNCLCVKLVDSEHDPRDNECLNAIIETTRSRGVEIEIVERNVRVWLEEYVDATITKRCTADEAKALENQFCLPHA